MKFAALVAVVVALVILVCLVPAVGVASAFASPPASTPTISAGGAGGHVLPPSREVIWSEPPDLNGMIGSSEVIGAYGLETEIANDFYLPQGTVISRAHWWGGYFNNYGCSDIGVATHWNLRFFDDGGCMPGTVISEHLNVSVEETFVHCLGGAFPIFRYEGSACVVVEANTRYWFSAQASDHTYPPSCGRLSSARVVGCDAVFRSAYFGYPDWVQCIDAFGVRFDASQEFEEASPGYGGACCLPNGSCVETNVVNCGDWLNGHWHPCAECESVHCVPPQACCFAGGHCEMLTDWGCLEQHGEPQGAEAICDPNPCELVAVADTAIAGVPFGIQLYPNPATGTAWIHLDLSSACLLQVTIHDVAGHVVRRLQDGRLTAGPHELRWDGRDNAGQTVAAGVYVARVNALGVDSSARVVVVR